MSSVVVFLTFAALAAPSLLVLYIGCTHAGWIKPPRIFRTWHMRTYVPKVTDKVIHQILTRGTVAAPGAFDLQIRRTGSHSAPDDRPEWERSAGWQP